MEDHFKLLHRSMLTERFLKTFNFSAKIGIASDHMTLVKKYGKSFPVTIGYVNEEADVYGCFIEFKKSDMPIGFDADYLVCNMVEIELDLTDQEREEFHIPDGDIVVSLCALKDYEHKRIRIWTKEIDTVYMDLVLPMREELFIITDIPEAYYEKFDFSVVRMKGWPAKMETIEER